MQGGWKAKLEQTDRDLDLGGRGEFSTESSTNYSQITIYSSEPIVERNCYFLGITDNAYSINSHSCHSERRETEGHK